MLIWRNTDDIFDPYSSYLFLIPKVYLHCTLSFASITSCSVHITYLSAMRGTGEGELPESTGNIGLTTVGATYVHKDSRIQYKEKQFKWTDFIIYSCGKRGKNEKKNWKTDFIVNKYKQIKKLLYLDRRCIKPIVNPTV